MLPLDPRAARSHTLPRAHRSYEDFPDARIDEILDVRRELTDPLTRFRSAVAGMAP